MIRLDSVRRAVDKIRRPAPAPAVAAPPAAPSPPPARRPPPPGFISSLSVDEILANDGLKSLVERIQTAACANEHEFSMLFLTPIRRATAWVHLLPATQADMYCAPGGALRLALESALISLQASKGENFGPVGGVEADFDFEIRWRHACFLGGLARDLWRPLTGVTITDGAELEWTPFSGPLALWLSRHGLLHYRMQWGAHTHPPRALRLEGVPVLQNLLSAQGWEWVHATRHRSYARVLHCYIAGWMQPGDHPLVKVIERANAEIARHDAASGRPYARAHGIAQRPANPVRQIGDVMRELFRSGRWPLNQPGGVAWYGGDGLWLTWPRAATDIANECQVAGIPGLPSTPEAIAHLLEEAAALHVAEPGNPLWSIRMPVDDAGNSTLAVAVLVATPEEFLPEGAQPDQALALDAGGEMPIAEGAVSTTFVGEPPQGHEPHEPIVELPPIQTVPVPSKPAFFSTPLASQAATPEATSPPSGKPESGGKGRGNRKDKQRTGSTRNIDAPDLPATQSQLSLDDALPPGPSEPPAPPPPRDAVLNTLVPHAIRAGVGRLTAEVLGHVVQTYRSDPSSAFFAETLGGVAIAEALILQAGVEADTVAEDLRRRDMLAEDDSGGALLVRLVDFAPASSDDPSASGALSGQPAIVLNAKTAEALGLLPLRAGVSAKPTAAPAAPVAPGPAAAAPPAAAAAGASNPLLDDLRRRLSTPVMDLLAEWAEAYAQGSEPEAFANHPQGLAVSYRFADSSDAPAEVVVAELDANLILVPPPDDGDGDTLGHPFHMVRFADGRREKSIVVERAVAEALGFIVLDTPRQPA